MTQLELTATPARNLVHYTPLRYPGGKGKLAPYVKSLIKSNGLLDGQYVEPYAGGAAIALELLFHEYVAEVFINDISRPIYSFWKSVLDRPDDFCRKLTDAPVTVDFWDTQKRVFANAKDHNEFDLGFATFFLNRTNRSGILNAGIIGGRAQTSEWGIDARLNKDELCFRIMSISKMKDRINLSSLDAIEFLEGLSKKLRKKSLIYLDPPYYKKGRDLYYDFYKHEDHASVATFVQDRLRPYNWIVSYDNAPEIQELYRGQRSGTYSIGYSVRSAGTGSEVMFFSDSMRISPLVGAIKPVGWFDEREADSAERQGSRTAA